MTIEAYRAGQQAIDNNDVDFFKKEHTSASINANSPEGGWTLLMYAAMENNSLVAKYLIEQLGAIPDVLNDNHDTALIIAARYHATEVVDLLLVHKADYRIRNKQERDALRQAIAYGCMPCVKLLLPLFIEPFQLNTPDSRGYTELYFAVNSDNVEMLKLLMDNGADATLLDDEGYSLIHEAVLNSYPAIVSYFLEQNVPFERTLPDGRDIIEVALTKRIRKMLTQYLA